jgi:molecular chaperone GrpE
MCAEPTNPAPATPEPTSPEAPAGEEVSLRDELQQLQTEVTELRGKLVRWQAELHNVQRRADKEMQEIRQRTNADFAGDFMPLLDQFDMAMSALPQDGSAQSMLDGIKIMKNEFAKIMLKRGVESFDPTGQPFDPHQHEAVMMVPHQEGVAPMTIVQTFTVGYTCGGRVIRPAKVKVAS